ncbi:unnamed protein product [Adineta steineri]|uniref:Uncharacterized protein n=1 Tax=Adineta steineri TaxID=433720 RepID=A0A813U6Z8_9BILA|nr:unnamed protein product [Adineta steineri]CAF1236811.1 unnamed protein product [Adineta steineri]
MMNNIGIFILLVFACVVINGQWITEKHVDGIIDRDDDYWVVKTNGKVSRPKFPAYIRFYNTHTRKSEYKIDVSRSAQILYYNGPPQIIFRTAGHYWSEGDSYYITLDEGVLYSNDIENSTEYLSPKFWRFRVVRPLIIA